jgi:hypothetical protein
LIEPKGEIDHKEIIVENFNSSLLSMYGTSRVLTNNGKDKLKKTTTKKSQQTYT